MSEDPLTPQSLGKPSPPDPSPRSSTPGKKIWLIAGLVLILGLAGVGYLSNFSTESSPPVRPTPTPVPAATPTPDPTQRLAAEQALEELLTALGPLKVTDPEVWGGETWEELAGASDRGDQALANSSWIEATAAYEQALKLTQQLLSDMPEVPGRLFPQAFEAYAQGNRSASVRMLQAILQIDAEHPQALELLPRAELADQSHARLQKATQWLEAGDLELAYAEIRRLRDADPDFPGAASVGEEVETQLADSRLETLLGRALTALDAQDLDTAEIAVKEAKVLAPNNPSVLDVETQVQAAVLEREVISLREKAEQLTQEGRWKASHEAWLEIQALDPDAPWVIKGLRTSLRWAVIDEKLRQGLLHPASPQTGKWVEEFADRSDWPAALDARADTLETTWKAWNTPVPVQLMSDGETEVLLPRVGRWKEVIQKEIELLPGEYVAKGIRLGYRDVRVPFTVPPGDQTVEVTVICVEGI